MNWLDRFTWPRKAITDMQRDLMAVRVAVLQIPTRLTHLEKLIMASDRDLLAAIAAGLAALSPELDRILTENTALKAENANLRGEAAADEAADTAAAQPAKDALDALIAKLAPVAPADPTPIEDVPAVIDDAPAPADPEA